MSDASFVVPIKGAPLLDDGSGELGGQTVPNGERKKSVARRASVLASQLVRRVQHAPPGEDEGDGAKAVPAKAVKLKGILRTGEGGRRKKDLHVEFRTVLAGEEAHVQDVRIKQAQEAEERERRARLLNIAKLARLPTLTIEELMIPLRLAFPDLIVNSPMAMILDIISDSFELCWIVKTIREQPTLEEVRKMEENGNKAGDEKSKIELYTAAHAVRDIGTVLSLHFSRGIYIISGDDTLWTLVQVVRTVRVRELVAYVQQINNDLTTNVKFLAVYKFSLVLISVPHWVACIWWALAARWGGEVLALPSWPAQVPLLTSNRDLNAAQMSDVDNYIMSLYMAWMGLTSMGYGTLVLTIQQEVIFAAFVAMLQMVFYAFVLGTLFHYLVRTDENTVHYNELMKAVDEYVSHRKLPKELAAKIRAHYAFQHRKQAAGTERIFGQMPLSMRTEVAVSQHSRQMHATWVFWACTPQFLSYVALYLRERYMMPSETLFKRGDGAAELLWCVGGSLHVSKGDQHITTIRSDLGPGQIVGEVAFFIGIQQPYSVVASSKGEVTLIVLTSAAFEEIIGSYPEQTDQITQNLLRKYGLDKNGADLTSGGFNEQMDEDEQREYEALRSTIRAAILERNEELFAQMSTAVHQGDVETVRALTARGFDLGAGSYDMRTPLHLASMEGHRTVVKVLCELGAEVNTVDRFGSTPIKNAVEGKHGAVADELSRFGARLSLARPASRLHAAAKTGDMNTMTMLVAHGININSVNYDGRTALHVAASEGNARVSEYLISNMADVHARDRWEHSPLDDAIDNDHPLVAQMLVRSSAKPDIKTMAELLRTSAAGGDTDRLKFLLSMGVDIDAADYDDRTALHYAVRSGSVSSTHLLVCALADVNIVDRWLRPPLLDALEVNPKIASVLLQAGARVPDSHKDDPEITAKVRAAEASDLYDVNRAISDTSRQRDKLNEAKLSKSREVEMEIAGLADEFGGLTRAQRGLFRQVSKHADIWIAEYGEEGDSDTDSDIGSQEGGSGRMDPEDPDSDSDDTDSDDGKMEGSTSKRQSKHFIKLVLQLPKAEDGLVEIRNAFRTKLGPDMRKHMPEQQRRLEEDKALYQMLQQEFGIPVENADRVLDDIYAELNVFLGDVAPKAPVKGTHATAAHSRDDPMTGADFSAADEMEELAAEGGHAFVGTRKTAHKVDDIKRNSLRRGSNAGTSLIDLSMARSNADSSFKRNGLAHLRKKQMTHPTFADFLDSDEPIFLSDLGHVVLFCSRRFIDTLAERHVKAAREAGVKDMLATPPKRDPNAPQPPPIFEERSGSDLIKSGGLKAVTRAVRASFNGSEQGTPGMSRFRPSQAKNDGSPTGQDRISPKRGAASPPSWSPDGQRRASLTLEEADGKNRRSTASSDQDPSFIKHLTVTPKGGGSFYGDGAADAMRSVEKALFIITSLFRVFDHAGKGVIRLRDVKRLQGDLGELGSTEIKSLLSYLMAASRTFALPAVEDAGLMVGAPGAAEDPFYGRRRSSTPAFDLDGRKSGKRTSQKLRTSLMLSADGIVMKAQDRQPEAHKPAAMPPASEAIEPPPAAAPDVVVSLSANVAPPNLDVVEEAAPAEETDDAPLFASGELNRKHIVSDDAADEMYLGRGNVLGALGQDKVQATRPGRARKARAMTEVQFFVGVASWILLSHSEDADRDEGLTDFEGIAAAEGVFIPKLKTGPAAAENKQTAAAAAKAAKAEAAAKAAHEEAIVRELDAALNSVAACLLLADNLQQRVDTGRINLAEPTDTEVLLKAVQHSVVIPHGTNAGHIEQWVEVHLDMRLGTIGTHHGHHPERGSETGHHAHAHAHAHAAGEEGGSEDGLREDKLIAAELEEGIDTTLLTWQTLLGRLRERAATLRNEAGDNLNAQQAKKGPVAAVLEAFGVGSSAVVPVDDANAEGGHEGEGEGGAVVWPWYIMSVRSQWYSYIHTLFLVLVMWDALFVPMQLAYFDEISRMPWVLGLNLTFDVLYAMRIVLLFHTTYINEKSVEVFRPREIRRQYLAGDFALDLFACWPHDQVLWALGVPTMIRFGLRLLRMINCRYAFASFGRWKAKLSDSDFSSGLIKNLTPLFITIHYMACVWNVLGFSDVGRTFGIRTWADVYLHSRQDVGGEITIYSTAEEKLLDQYLTAIFFVLSLISALGVAQLPANMAEFFAFVVLAILNMTIYAYCVGGISGLVMKQDDEIVGKRAHLELVHAYVRHVHVPPELKDRMTKFFVQRLQHTSLSSVDSEQIYSGLPMPLQMEVAAHTNRALVGNCALLRGCSTGFLDRLSSSLRERELEAETVVFRSGEACKELMIVASGTIETLEEGEGADDSVETLGPGDTVAEVAFVFRIRHFKTARVGRNEKAFAFTLATELYKELLKAFPTQEDIIMDNAVRQYEGMATARSGKSGKSKASSGGGSSSALSAGDGNSSVGGRSDLSNVQDVKTLHKILAEAKRKREELMHARLCTACAKGDYDKVRRMLTGRSIDIDHGDFEGRRALHLAACGGDKRVIELLLASRADVNIEDSLGNTPLDDALHSDNADAAAQLASHGGRHGSRNVADEVCTAGSHAEGKQELQRLCQYGGNVNAATHEQRTALHIAASEGRVDNLRMLLENKADVNARDRRGSTPLQDALLGRQDEACELLLQHGAMLGEFDTALHMNTAAAENDTLHLARLIKFRCSINTQDELGRAPVHLAASRRRINALNFLLDTADIDVNIEDKFGNTAYDDAMRDSAKEQKVLRALLETRGARPGSHVHSASMAQSDMEAERQTVAARVVSQRDLTLTEARTIRQWVKEEREAVAAFNEQLKVAIALQRERGAVLADELPELWEQVYAYAEGYFDWREEALQTVAPTIRRWFEQNRDFALVALQKLQQKFHDLAILGETDAKPVERLYEVTFRKPVKVDGR